MADTQVPVYFPGTSNAAALLDGIKYGLLGNADVTIYTLYNSDYLAGYSFPAVKGPTGGSLIEVKFVGLVGPVPQIGMTKAVVTVQDLFYLLNHQIPRRLFQASCSHTLFDVGCGLSAASFTKNGGVATVLSTTKITTTARLSTTSSNGTFAKGVLTWTSGANKGLSSMVCAWTEGYTSSSDALQLDVAPIFAISPGDTFTIAQGCSQTFTSCADLQGATKAYLNFGGQPNTPVPETAIG